MIPKINLKQAWANVWPWVLVLGVWQAFFSLNLANPAFLASPANIFSSFLSFEFWQVLGVDLASSFSRLSLGLFVAYLLSMLVIYLSIWLPPVYTLVRSINNVWKYLPAPVVIPLSILAFGLTDSAKTSVVAFTVFVLYLSHTISILSKDYAQYNILAESWKLTPNQRFWHIFFPQNNYLSYRILPQVVLWGMATAILTELILGGQTGLGLRLLLFQQLYKTGFLYAYLAVILLLSFGLEKVLINLFSRYKWDLVKIFSSVVVVALAVSALWIQLPTAVASINSNRVKIVSFKGVINLPIIVYQKKFNRLGAEIELVSTGLQAMDAMQAGKATIGGYSDMPNALQALQSNKSLKLVSQLTETQTNPALFLVANKKLNSQNLSDLNGAKIAYFPNNPVIQQGLDFVLFTRNVQTSSVEYQSGNDPNTLVQSMVAGKIDALVAFEPYIADIESKLGTERVNKDKTLIGTINFKHLPLAGLVVNTDTLKAQQKTDFLEDINKSLEFIRANTSSDHLAQGELKAIMDEAGLNLNSHIPDWQNSNEVESEDLGQLVAILKTYAVQGFDNLDLKKLDEYYLR